MHVSLWKAAAALIMKKLWITESSDNLNERNCELSEMSLLVYSMYYI